MQVLAIRWSWLPIRSPRCSFLLSLFAPTSTVYPLYSRSIFLYFEATAPTLFHSRISLLPEALLMEMPLPYPYVPLVESVFYFSNFAASL